MSSLKVRKIIEGKKCGIAKIRYRPQIIESLPIDMITEIVARVGATSPIDLFRCKQVCKIIHEIAEEKRVLQQVTTQGLITWRNQEKAESFFKKCRDCNNPSALYRFGMIQYFSQLMVVEGLMNLEKAATQRHEDAIYTFALILLCSGDNECVKKGVDLLLNLMNTIKGEGIVKLRLKLRDSMITLWWLRLNTNGASLAIVHPKITCAMGELHEIESCWDKECYDDEKVEDNVACGACKCSREAAFFRHLVMAGY